MLKGKSKAGQGGWLFAIYGKCARCEFELYSVNSHGQMQKKDEGIELKFRQNLGNHEKSIQLPPNTMKL